MVTPEEAKKISPLISTEGMLAASWSPHDGKATPESVVMGYAATARATAPASSDIARSPISTAAVAPSPQS